MEKMRKKRLWKLGMTAAPAEELGLHAQLLRDFFSHFHVEAHQLAVLVVVAVGGIGALARSW